MDKKNILVVGGSSGIGLELVKVLSKDNHEVYVGSRTSQTLAETPGVHHIELDVLADPINLEALPDVLHGLVYCPGTII